MTDKEKIRNEVERLMNDLIQEKEKGYGSDIDDACILELQNLLTFINSLQEESASNDLEEAAHSYVDTTIEWFDSEGNPCCYPAFKAGAQWQAEHLWKDAQGDDLPEIDREVVALIQDYPDDKEHLRIAYAHRPPEYWDGKNILTGEVTRYEPKRHDKGGWNLPNVKYWLDVELPKGE